MNTCANRFSACKSSTSSRRSCSIPPELGYRVRASCSWALFPKTFRLTLRHSLRASLREPLSSQGLQPPTAPPPSPQPARTLVLITRSLALSTPLTTTFSIPSADIRSKPVSGSSVCSPTIILRRTSMARPPLPHSPRFSQALSRPTPSRRLPPNSDGALSSSTPTLKTQSV